MFLFVVFFLLYLAFMVRRVHGVDYAVNQVAEATPPWVECVRQAVLNDTKYEELQVRGSQLSGCTMQLLTDAQTKTTASNSPAPRLLKKASTDLVKASHALAEIAEAEINYSLSKIKADDYTSLTEANANKLIIANAIDIKTLEKQLASYVWGAVSF